MTLSSGEILGLIGPNGSGKTTSFNVLTGIYKATSGQVFFEGRELTNTPARTVYEAIVRTSTLAPLPAAVDLRQHHDRRYRALDQGCGRT